MASVKLREVIKRANTKVDKDNTNLIYYVGGEHIESENIRVHKCGLIAGSTIGPMFYYGFKAGDFLLVSRNPHLKKAGLVNFDGICSEKTFVLETVDPTILLPEFLPFVLQNKRFWDYAYQHRHGSTNTFINWSTLSDYEFELPDLETQRKLAAVLWSINDTMESYKKLISATDELVKSQFIERFGLPGTDPYGWGLKTLGECCELNPRRPKNMNAEIEYSFVAMPSVSEDGRIDTTIERPYAEVCKGFTYFAENDVLFAKITPCMENGKGGVAKGLKNGAGFGSTEFHVLRPIEGVSNPYWLYIITMFQKFRSDAEKVMTGTGGQRRVPITYLNEYKIALPPLELQEQFAAFVRQSDKSKLLVPKSMSSSYYTRLLISHLNHNKGGIKVETKRKTFAAYLEDEYYDLMFNRLKTHVYQNKSRLNLHTSLVTNPSYIALDDIHVMGVTFKETEDDRILFRAAVQTDIVVKGKTRRDYEEDMVSAWFAVSFTGILRGGLTMVTITSVEDYTKECFSKEDALTKFLVPYVYAKDLDLHAEKFLNKYCRRALETPMPLPIKEVLEAMCLTVYPAPLPDGIFGRTYFNSATVDIYKDRNSDEIISAEIEEGTILVSPDSFLMRNIGCTHNTIIHECVHWDKHYKFFELQKLINPEITSISCKVVEQYKKGNDELSNELEWMEWQASAIAPKILIPARTGRMKLNEILIRLTQALPTTRRAEIMQLAISEFADFFQVSTMAAKIRAIELGFEQAAGVFNYVDGHYYPPFSFKKGTLKKDQTFIIDRNNAIFESTFNETLASEYRAGHFIHAGGMFVINDPKYVHIQEDAEAELTDYALEHIDECCLIFNRETRVSKHYDDSYYRICFLCRDADSKSFVEADFNPREGKNEDVLKRAQEMSTIMAEAKRVSEILADIPSSFCGTLDYHVKRRGYTNEKMEERTGISSRMIQDYRNKRDAKPTLPSVLALCIGLNLQPAFSYDLISKAGHNIMTPIEENLVYQYLINNHHMENIRMWNQKLQDAGIAQQLPKNGNKNTAP